MKIKNTLIIVFIFISTNSFAYLNEHTSRKLKSMRTTQSKAVQVREDIDDDGVIRKVSWKGMHHPELNTLLGPCYSYYQDYLKQNTRLRMRGAISIDKNGCHISVGGHMGNVTGEASLDK